MQVAIKKLPAATVYRDSYHAKQVYREVTLLKQVRACSDALRPHSILIIVAQLRHPNLIKLVDAFSSPANDLYMVFEAMVCELAVTLYICMILRLAGL